MSTLLTHRPPADIEASIAATSARLGADLKAIQAKLSPRDLLRRNAAELVRFVKRHPVPVVLIGAGLGWLATRKRHE